MADEEMKDDVLIQADEEISNNMLIQAIASKQEWALETLYKRYRSLLSSLAYRIVADDQIVEDLLQESFLAVWRNASSYSSQSDSVLKWLLSIVHHKAIDYVRSRGHRVARESIALDEAEMISTSSDVWEEVWQLVQNSRVREAVTKLPPEQRLVIELAYFQGWTHAEIAARCQLPLGTVKARMRLGLMRTKRILEHMGVSEF